MLSAVKESALSNSFSKSFARAAASVVAAAALAAAAFTPASAQTGASVSGRLRLDSLERLAPKAVETVNVEIDGILIKFASVALSDKDPDERTVKEIISGLRGVYVKSYEFKSEGQFTEGDLASVREQLSGPGWSRIVDIKSLDDADDNAEVYVATDAGRVEALAILSVEPKEVTVINIVGSIDIEKLKRLEGSLGIPRIHIHHRRHAARRADDDEKQTTAPPPRFNANSG